MKTREMLLVAEQLNQRTGIVLGKSSLWYFLVLGTIFPLFFFLGRSSDRSASLVDTMQDLDNAVCHLSWSDTVSSLHSPKGWLSSGFSPMWTWLARLLAGLCSYQHAFKNSSDVIGFLPASQAAVSMQAQKPVRVHRGAAAFCTSPVAGVWGFWQSCNEAVGVLASLRVTKTKRNKETLKRVWE